MDRGELDLEDLAEGSLLEACNFLGILQNEGYPLNRKRASGKGSKGETLIGVPCLGLSLITQRLLHVERARRAALERQVAELEVRLAAAGVVCTKH